ncbi:MAG TPA: response regulator transcription factor [Gemmatimonadaceae bacterium]|jgi:DNA-binding NarL/FixJ family response regulator
MPVRVVLADPHSVVLVGLRTLLESERDVQVVATAVDGAETLKAVRDHNPDLLFVERDMQRPSGIEVVRTLRSENHPTRAIMLGSVLRPDDIAAALRAGARGILPWDRAAADGLRCLRVVASGGHWLDGDAPGDRVRSVMNSVADSQGDALTRRERELAEHVAAGLRNAAIALRLGISEGTVKIHLNRIYRKLGLPSRVALALYLRENG